MGADDALLSELGVTARGERDVARDVIRDAALAAAARAASARRVPATADAEAAEDDAGTGAGATRGGAGGGGGGDPGLVSSYAHAPATRELRRLREEAETVTAELASVRDAMDDVREKVAEGTAPADAPLVIAEQFGMLEALHPGRIDLGIGRAPGTDQLTASALRRTTDGRRDPELPSLLMTATLHPSPRAKPSARLSNVWQRPATDVMPAIAMPTLLAWSSIRLTPAARCMWHSACCSARAAEWHATSDAEHAVSNDAHGPCSPSANDTRPDAIESEFAVAYTLRPSGLPASSCANSVA